MAKRRKSKTQTQYRTRTKTIRSYVGRAKQKAGGLIAGLIAGAGGQVLNRYAPLGAWSQPAADIATGLYLKNDTLQTIGGRTIGAMLASGALRTVTGTGTGTVAALQ